MDKERDLSTASREELLAVIAEQRAFIEQLLRRIAALEALRWARAVDGPALVEFIIEPEENVYPMVAPGGALTEIIDA
ncbi:MAG: hypothetical protein ACYC1C_17390 [Chloroflexota bacterium]